MSSNTLGSPIPLSDLESILAWVDTFKLSRPTRKIHRDFSDGVLLAEILAVHYPKLVEMHNYPPRNSHALKLNNWMTLNRKVLKKLKLTLCSNTMDQLTNCAPGVIERVLIMVRDKIKRDEELEKSTKEGENNQSSGGSYYEACGDEDHVLVVPVKTRVNGVLEMIQRKVVSYDAYNTLKEQAMDHKDTVELLKQKVEHLESLLKLKDERITELQKQLDKKQSRRKEPEIITNTICAPFEDTLMPSSTDAIKVDNISSESNLVDDAKDEKLPTPKASKVKILSEKSSKVNLEPEINDILPNSIETVEHKSSEPRIVNISNTNMPNNIMPHITNTIPDLSQKISESNVVSKTSSRSSIPVAGFNTIKVPSKSQMNVELIVAETKSKDKIKIPPAEYVTEIEKINSDVFITAAGIDDRLTDVDDLEFKDSEAGNYITINESINKELIDISLPNKKDNISGDIKYSISKSKVLN